MPPPRRRRSIRRDRRPGTGVGDIRVNAVSPGSIMFPGGGWDTFQREHPDDFAVFLASQFPFGRLGRPEEVADVVTFLLSARASWITGANVAVDGGQIYPSARRFD